MNIARIKEALDKSPALTVPTREQLSQPLTVLEKILDKFEVEELQGVGETGGSITIKFDPPPGFSTLS